LLQLHCLSCYSYIACLVTVTLPVLLSSYITFTYSNSYVKDNYNKQTLNSLFYHHNTLIEPDRLNMLVGRGENKATSLQLTKN